MNINDRERQIIRPALEARIEALKPKADPENPWMDQDAADEIQELEAIIRKFDAADVAAADQLLDDIINA